MALFSCGHLCHACTHGKQRQRQERSKEGSQAEAETGTRAQARDLYAHATPEIRRDIAIPQLLYPSPPRPIHFALFAKWVGKQQGLDTPTENRLKASFLFRDAVQRRSEFCRRRAGSLVFAMKVERCIFEPFQPRKKAIPVGMAFFYQY
jgi:hypothetical protein